MIAHVKFEAALNYVKCDAKRCDAMRLHKVHFMAIKFQVNPFFSYYRCKWFSLFNGKQKSVPSKQIKRVTEEKMDEWRSGGKI